MPNPIPSLQDLQIETLGPCTVTSPLCAEATSFVDENSRVSLLADSPTIDEHLAQGKPLPAFEAAGPRQNIFFDPKSLVCGIVTCGGICPGLNNVIRAITLTLYENYRVRQVLGFRYGYAGLAPDSPFPPLFLSSSDVDNIQEAPGTILGSSRGPQQLEAMLATLQKHNVSILFVIGGDGTLTGAACLAAEIKRHDLPISIIGIPKTIDNDLSWISRSFGFTTAVDAATNAIEAAHCEAQSAWNGVGLVKLMGRHSGFIAAHASVATGVVNFCLIPEVPFMLEGERGFLKALETRLARKRHAVVVVAEGAGQYLFETAGKSGRDASGNIKLMDIGPYLKDAIKTHFSALGIDFTVKYIDPSYLIRSLPAGAVDSEFCVELGLNAVHAGMAGKTNMVVGLWNQNFTHVPIGVVTGVRKQVNPRDMLWQTVMNTTHQPAVMV